MGQTTSKNTKTHNKNKRKSISKLFHAQTGSIWFQIGSYLVPIGSYGFYSSEIGSYKLKMVS